MTDESISPEEHYRRSQVALYALRGRFGAAAATALHDQPFGFTRDEWESLRIMAGEYDDHSMAPDKAKHVANVEAVAAKIAALLPPAP